MENLINFDDEISEPVVEKHFQIKTAPLIPSRNSIELAPDPSNPYEAMEFAASGYPYETSRFQSKNDESLHLTDGDNFSFDCFSNVSSIETHSKDSSITSQGSGKTVLGRSLSDSSTISAKSDVPPSVLSNRSLDGAAIKHNQLLKLSFYNSPNSPMKAEAKKLVKRFGESREASFEDLNNVTTELVDTSNDSISCDDDLKSLKVNIVKSESKPPATPSAKIAEFQEKLNKIKKEVDWEEVIDLSVDVKTEHLSPNPVKTEKADDQPENPEKGDGDKASEYDMVFSKFKSVLSEGNKDEAKKQLAKLNEMLGSSQEPKNTLTVQPIVRQGTFEIDQRTGKKKVAVQEAPKPVETSDELMEKLAEIFKTQSLDVRSMGLSDTAGTKIVVVVPSMSSTPHKSPTRQRPGAIRHKSAFKATEAKKFTPTKSAGGTSRLSMMPKTASKVPNPYEQKLGGLQSRVGSVRKSLLNSIDKSPQVMSAPPQRHPLARRSVSMKASIPQSQASKTSPTESGSATPRASTGAATPRPSTGAATPRPSINSAKRLSSATFVRPSTATKAPQSTTKPRPSTRASSQFKTPATLRKTSTIDRDSSLV